MVIQASCENKYNELRYIKCFFAINSTIIITLITCSGTDEITSGTISCFSILRRNERVNAKC